MEVSRCSYNLWKKLMYFGKGFESFSCAPIYLNGIPLEFVNEWKYLGVLITSGKNFTCSSKKSRCAFFRSTNSILNVLRGPSEVVQMKLLYSVCVPIITYASDVVIFPPKEMQTLHVAVNDAIRRIFSYQRWESIKFLRESFGYLSITELFANRKKTFEARLPQIGNSTLSFLSRNC